MNLVQATKQIQGSFPPIFHGPRSPFSLAPFSFFLPFSETRALLGFPHNKYSNLLRRRLTSDN